MHSLTIVAFPWALPPLTFETVLGLFLSLVGHAYLWTSILNHCYGRAWNKTFLKLLRLFIGVLILTFPLVNFFLANRFSILQAYATAMLYFGVTFYPIMNLWLWARSYFSLTRRFVTTHHDFGKKLGPTALGNGKNLWLAKLPRNEIFQLDVSTVTLSIPHWPSSWNGLSILLISDLHLHGTPSRDWFTEVFTELRKLPPADLVVLAGDYLDSDEHRAWLAPLLKDLNWKEHGIAVLGNHDKYHQPELVRRELEQLGYLVLGNRWETTSIRGEPCVLVGHEGPWFGPEPDLAKAPTGLPRICVSHSPDNIAWAKHHHIDLMLSGHVHGGSIRVPGIGSIFVPSRYGRRYDQGAFVLDSTILVVSRGLGGKEPLRWNCPPQVIRMTINTNGI